MEIKKKDEKAEVGGGDKNQRSSAAQRMQMSVLTVRRAIFRPNLTGGNRKAEEAACFISGVVSAAKFNCGYMYICIDSTMLRA